MVDVPLPWEFGVPESGMITTGVSKWNMPQSSTLLKAESQGRAAPSNKFQTQHCSKLLPGTWDLISWRTRGNYSWNLYSHSLCQSREQDRQEYSSQQHSKIPPFPQEHPYPGCCICEHGQGLGQLVEDFRWEWEEIRVRWGKLGEGPGEKPGNTIPAGRSLKERKITSPRGL